MNRIITITISLLLAAATFAQSVPQTVNFSATVRDGNNNLLSNTNVTVRIAFSRDDFNTEIYWEEHTVTTNRNGFVSFLLNREMSGYEGSFNEIPWQSGTYKMKVQYKRTGDDGYVDLVSHELTSGFYAFVSNYVVNEADPTVPAWAKADTKPIYNYSEIQNAPANVSAFENDANYITLAEVPAESQTIADVAALGNSLNTQLKNVTDPTDAQDAATKKYIDDIVAPILAQNARMQATVDSLNYVLSLNAHEYVDLGLPSGTKWATCNVGANSPEEYGDYFAWGETTTKTTYDWSAYHYCNGSYNNTLTKYCNNSNYGNNGFTDALTTLEASDDAATANWGTGWRMPTQSEMQELIDNCTWEWTTQNNVNGYCVTGNGNSIFLPAAGGRYDGSLDNAGSSGRYWSSSLHTNSPDGAWYLYFSSGSCSVSYGSRYYGRSVRPVCVSQN